MSRSLNSNENNATIGFEQKLWNAADRLRGHMDPSEYKHIILGLIFLKYISDAFETKFDELSTSENANPEDRDEYLAVNVFWVPKNARWDVIRSNARTVGLGKIVDDAMISIEKENLSLKGVLPKDFSRPALDKKRLGDLVDLICTINLKSRNQKDLLGRIYEYFLSRFASAEGKGGGEFYTPQSVVSLLVEMLSPYSGRVYDPCCGSGGMFVQSEKFVEQHGGKIGDISIYGQESNYTTWRLCKMNLAIRGIEGNIGSKNADTFHNDLHKDLKADFIIANPPFNISYWGGEKLQDDVRWKFGTPPVGNANFAWVQHIIHHLAPQGIAGFVLANGSMSSNTSGEGEIRQRLVESELVDCIVALPEQLFYSTQISVCLWFLAKDRSNGLAKYNKFRSRSGEILFIDARNCGFMEDRTHRDLHPCKDIKFIVSAYHSWRGDIKKNEMFKNGYKDIGGFCKSVSINEVRDHDFALTPGRYVGLEKSVEDTEPFESKMKKLTSQLAMQMVESENLDNVIRMQLARVGYEI